MHSPDDTSGMFDVLTYQKGAAILRMLEQYLGAERFRDGIRLYLRGTHTATPRRTTSGTRSRKPPASRCGGSWTHGSGRAGTRCSRSRPTSGGVRIDQPRFLADGPDDHAVWDVPLRVRRSAARGRRCWCRPTAPRSCPRPDAAVVVQRRREQLRAGPVRGRAARAARRAAVRGLADGAVRTGRRPLGRGGVGAACASEFVAVAARFRDEDDLAVWQVLMQGLGWCDRFVEGEPRERFRAFVREPRGARAGPARAGRPTPTSRPGPGPARRAAAGTGGAGRRPERGGGRPRVRGGGSRGQAGRPVARRRRRQRGRGQRRRDGLRAVLARPTWTRRRRRSSSGTCSRCRCSATRRCWIARSRRAFGDEIRTQDAPFVLAYSRDQPRPRRPRVGVPPRSGGTSCGARSPRRSRSAWPRRAVPDPARAGAEAEAFFAEHPIPQSAKMLEQMLERQRVAAALRERATPDLAAYFSG